MRHAMRWMFAILILAGMAGMAGLAGCQSSKMVRSGTMDRAPVPAPGKAMVVFLRASSHAGAVQSSVYDTGTESDQFIGIISAKIRIA